jgi:hypothetical protein
MSKPALFLLGVATLVGSFALSVMILKGVGY